MCKHQQDVIEAGSDKPILKMQMLRTGEFKNIFFEFQVQG